MPPNLSGRVTVGDETLEPVLNVEVQYRKINQQICRGDVPALPWVVMWWPETGPKMADIVWSISRVLGDILALVGIMGQDNVGAWVLER